MKKYVLVLLFISLILFFINYRPGTYLAGWDNLQTELNPALAVKRAFFSVWQEYQSFGLTASMAHAADLPHALFIWIISFILPQSLIRYFFHIMMLFVGAWGAFSLIKKLLAEKGKEPLAFAGTLFYMLNFGTVQIFFLPFEAFSAFFGFLPWELLAFITVLEKKPEKKDYLFLFAINFLAMTQAYVQTVFVVYLIMLAFITVGFLIETKNPRVMKRALVALLIIFSVNAAWILPQIYFIASGGNRIVEEAKINQLATEGVLYLNKEKGTIPHLVNMEGLYYDLFGINKHPLFWAWQRHFSQPIIWLLSVVFLLTALLGLFAGRKHHLAFGFIFVFMLFVLLSATPPFSWVNDFARQNSFINQMFRSAFTKFIIPYALVMSCLFASGLDLIVKRLQPKAAVGVVVVSALFITIYAFPAFKGHFFSSEMKVKIPRDYFALFTYMEKQNKQKRIGLLPEYTFWSWFFHRFGYNGSGFLWYGIEQPIVSRTFDVWSDKSEGYFWEMKQAIESEDVTAFEKAIAKYDIEYLLMDRSLLPVAAILKTMQYDRIDRMLKKSRRISLEKKWGLIELYSVKKNHSVKSYLSYASRLPTAGPQETLTNRDAIYDDIGDYQVSEPFDLVYPFYGVMNQTRHSQKRWTLSEKDQLFTLTAPLPADSADYVINTAYQQSKTSIFSSQGLLSITDRFVIDIKNNRISATIPKIKAVEFVSKETKLENCSLTPWKGKNSKKLNNQKNDITVTSEKGALGCFGYFAPFLEQKYGYLLKVQNKNLQGKRLFLYILDSTKRQTYIEDNLENEREYFIISPKYPQGSGYSVVFQNYAYENVTSVNQVSNVTFYLFPYQEINNIFLTRKNAVIAPAVFYTSFAANQRNYFTYQTTVPTVSGSTLILNQSYEKNWKAYVVSSPESKGKRQKSKSKNFLIQLFPFFFGKELTNHVLVNNWANGWEITGERQKSIKTIKDSEIVVIFLPQYLQFAGFVIGIISFLLIIKTKYPIDKK